MSKSSTPVVVAPMFVLTALPIDGTQYRLTSGGTGTVQSTAYQQATRTLAAWGKATGNSSVVHALVHLGWCAGSGARAMCKASSSSAFKAGAEHLEVAAYAGPQVVRILEVLVEAGAPAEAVATVWATFTGSAA